MGKSNALEFTTAHEDNVGNPPAEKAMDLHNNARGADIGAANPVASGHQLAQAYHTQLLAGNLKVIKP